MAETMTLKDALLLVASLPTPMERRYAAEFLAFLLDQRKYLCPRPHFLDAREAEAIRVAVRVKLNA